MKCVKLTRCLCILAVFLSVAKAENQLVIYTEISPPYQYQEEDEIKGIASERVRQIIAHAGFNADFKMYPWARAMLSVERSSNALIYSMAKTPEREPRFHWIAPVAKFNLSILTLANRSDIQLDSSLALAGLTAAAQRDDIAESWLRSKGFVEGNNLLLCADILCSWQQLKLGTVDFIIEDPNLIAGTAPLVGMDAHDLKVVQAIPELSVVAYLAANHKMGSEMVQRLKNAADTLGFK